MNGFEKRATLIRNKIMKTTLDMLRTSGPKRIRIADISKEAKVSQVTIYNYFGSKETLLQEVFKTYVNKVISEFEEFMNGSYTLKEKIEYIISLEKKYYHELSPGLVKELLIDDQELTRYVEEIYNEKTLPMTKWIIEEGKKSGEISEDVSIESVLGFIQLYMNQYELILGMAQQSSDLDKFLDGMIHMFFYGICGKP